MEEGLEYNWGTGDYESVDSNGTRTTLDDWDAMNYLLSQSYSVKVYRTNALGAVNQNSGGGSDGGSSLSQWMQANIGPGPTVDLLSLVLSLAGLNPNAPANMMSLGIIKSLFVPEDAWIAIATKDTMEEWSKEYIKFNISSKGLFIDRADPNNYIKGITNPITGKIILAPGLFDGVRTNYGLGDVVIHEVNHFTNWKNGLLQGNHPLIQNMNEISAYKATAEWTGVLGSGINDYLYEINKYILNLKMLIK